MSTKSLSLIVLLLISLIAVVYLVLRPAVLTGRAAGTSSNSITLENSYLFASPLQAKADGKEKIRVTVFLLDGRGVGVANQTVELIRPQSITTINVQPVSDDSGKSVFDLTSVSSGKFEINAKVNSKEIPQKVKVTFL